jgi:hypothetical protein
MNPSFSRKVTIVATSMIIAVFAWEQSEEKAAVEQARKETAGRMKISYDGGWTRGFAMLLCGAIIGIQIYHEVIARKK